LAKDAGQTETPAEAGLETKVISPTGMSYLIQVGAFKAVEDAEQMRARMAILGFEARVSETEREGSVFHRVRLGPYGSIEELNKAKARVSENGIESAVIRVNVR
jgi:cell division protein FtsN